MIFDTHSHYEDKKFAQDRAEILSGLAEHNVEMVVNVGSDMETSRQTLELTCQYPHVFGAIGVHPSETGELTEADMEWLLQHAREPKVVAIGEIGLDYYWDEPDRQTQKMWFVRQLEVARQAHLPVIIHSRDAAEDTMNIMREHGADIGGVIHCYSYSPEMAAEYVKMGYYIGVGGVVTFKNAKKLVETVKAIPMERIVLETDCPYMAPEPERGSRNDSTKLRYVAQKIAELRGMTAEEVIRITRENALCMYRMEGVDGHTR